MLHAETWEWPGDEAILERSWPSHSYLHVLIALEHHIYDDFATLCVIAVYLMLGAAGAYLMFFLRFVLWVDKLAVLTTLHLFLIL